MKKRIISLLLVVAVLATMLPAALAAGEYKDTAGHWGEDSIDRWTGYGVVGGYGDTFLPNGEMTRAELARVLVNLLDLQQTASVSQYQDVKADDWFYSDIAKCVAAGILNGVGSSMEPNRKVTREEMFTMFARALGIAPKAASSTTFADGDEVSSWAAGYINALADMGVISGVGGGKLDPGANINRASVMRVLDNAISDYANTDGVTVGASSGIVLVVADHVTVAGNVENLVVAGSNNTVTLSGGVTADVAVLGENSTVNVSASAAVNTVVIDEKAAGSTVNVAQGAAVAAVDSKADRVTITGEGVVETAVVSGDHTTVNTDGTDLTVAVGTVGVTENSKPVSGGATVETEPVKNQGTVTPSTPSIPILTYYTVTFVSDGAAPSTQQVLSGTAVARPEDPAKEGYTFRDWFNGETAYDFASPVYGDLTLTAKWKHTASGLNGLGTAEDPFLIETAEELSKIIVGTDDNIVYYKLTSDIDLSTSQYDGASYLVNAVFDGNGHKLYSSAENGLYGVFNIVYGTTTIKNLTYDLSNLGSYGAPKDCTPLVYKVVGTCDVTIDSVKIVGSHTVDSNNAPFVMNEYIISGSKLTLKNCEYAADMQGSGWNSCFVGWQGATFTTTSGEEIPCENSLISFENCIVSGSMVCEKAAVFVANGSKAYTRNYAFTNNTITGTVRGTEAVGYFTAVSVKPGYEFENQAAQSCGGADDTKVYVGATDSMLAITDATGAGLTITPSDNSNVTKYVVEVGISTTLYNNGKNAGTWKYFVRQEIAASESMTVGLKNTGFVDDEYCTSNNITVTTDELGNSVAEINGTMYYVIKDYIDDAGDQGYVGSPTNPSYRAATIIRVSAYVGDVMYSSAVITK